MRIKLFIILLCLGIVLAKAQYPQILHITNTSFFAATALGAEHVLDKGVCTTNNDVVIANQWNTSRTSNPNAEPTQGVSPIVEKRILRYSNYVDMSILPSESPKHSLHHYLIVLNPKKDSRKSGSLPFSRCKGKNFSTAFFEFMGICSKSAISAFIHIMKIV